MLHIAYRKSVFGVLHVHIFIPVCKKLGEGEGEEEWVLPPARCTTQPLGSTALGRPWR